MKGADSMAKGWVVLHVSDETPFSDRWVEISIRVGSVFAVTGPPVGWSEGATILSTGDRLLYVQETRDEVLRLCEGAA